MTNINQTILYVDDETLNLMLFEKLFGKSFTIVTANSPIKALNMLKQNPGIKLVFSDMKMPDMNGIEFIAQAQKEFSDKIYYIITGYDMNHKINDAIKSGLITDCLHKPFNIEQINKTIKLFLKEKVII